MVDIHTHILPGIDDGAVNLEDSLRMARLAHADGVSIIAATPHAYWRSEINDGVIIRRGVEEVNQVIREAAIPINVVPGCEVVMRRSTPEQIAADPMWTIAGGRAYLLLEPPWGPLPDFCFDLISEISELGITPIIAHPERSPDLQSNPSLIERMIEMGAMTQVTANSITGQHGGLARNIALRLLQGGNVHVVASDSHNSTNRSPILSAAREEVRRLVGEEIARRLFEENPRQIVEGLPISVMPAPDPVPAEERPGGIGGLFRKIIGR
ncbi:MAG TPA: CpsB/CapC family capsule biosynthesis tyrosine phosphatase [Armatimonadota bacterium]|nr:CpsB/CapC family capsule biosynthesis tyrosine phosphatase [Armatimonadota bacterium]